MNPHRISVKLYLDDPAALDAEAVVPPFHRYIREDAVGGIPIDGALLPPGHGFGLGFAVRLATGQSPVPGSVGTYHWSGIGGTSFFVDPQQDLYALLLTQAPNQRDHYRQLFRNLVYAALD